MNKNVLTDPRRSLGLPKSRREVKSTKEIHKYLIKTIDKLFVNVCGMVFQAILLIHQKYSLYYTNSMII